MSNFGNQFSGNVPSVKVELSVVCKNLANRDALSKSDPMCVLFMKLFRNDMFSEVGRTEIVKDSLNPTFIKKFLIDYYFEEVQKLRFEIYDSDSPSGHLDKHDKLGFMECTLGEIVGTAGSKFERKVQASHSQNATILVRYEELLACKEIVTLQMEAHKLDKKDLLGKSDPFVVLSRANEDGSYTAAYKTEIIKKNLNPQWRPFTLKMNVLCNGDYARPIRFDCYDWDSDGSHDLIGSAYSPLGDIRKFPTGGFELDLIHPEKKAKKKGYTNSGKLLFTMCKIEVENTFLDYVYGGMQLNFTVAIDFTASNGNPTEPTSLHYISPYQPNQYCMALQAVGEIIQDYDSDKMFPALGFGAKLPGGTVSHEFPLNGNPSNPFCAGIAGVMQAYQQTLRSVQLYGPTNFAPVINHVAKFASTYRDGTNYFVLLIITDGVITDLVNTKAAIINASKLPMSIIIVGVGDAEFDAMGELDSDNQALTVNNRVAERDIVQFVPFQKFMTAHFPNAQMRQAHLAKEVLAEIPDQVVGYMKKQGLKPRTPPPNMPIQAPTGPSAPPFATAPSMPVHAASAPSAPPPYPGQ
jgi:hypothetical protein